MTFVGKILVILIMAFSLVFLGVSIVTFTTAVNWKAETDKQKTLVTKKQGELSTAKEQAADAQTKLDVATKSHKTALDEKDARIADLDKQIKAASEETLRAQTSLEQAQANAKVALEDAAARKGQIDVLNETIAKAQAQANLFNAQNIELTDQKRVLEREKATAEENAKSLRRTNVVMSGYLQKMGVSASKLSDFDPTTVPPDVEGRVSELNSTGRLMELSVGSDDGLAVGQELYVFRIQPRAEYPRQGQDLGGLPRQGRRRGHRPDGGQSENLGG